MKLSRSKEREVLLRCAKDPDAREDWRKRSIRCEIAALFGGGAITHADLKALSEHVLGFDLEERLAMGYKENRDRFTASYWDGASVATSMNFYATETVKPGDFFKLMLVLLRFIVARLPAESVAETVAKFWTLVSDYPADELPAEILGDKDYKAALGNQDAGSYTDSDRARDERQGATLEEIKAIVEGNSRRLGTIGKDVTAIRGDTKQLVVSAQRMGTPIASTWNYILGGLKENPSESDMVCAQIDSGIDPNIPIIVAAVCDTWEKFKSGKLDEELSPADFDMYENERTHRRTIKEFFQLFDERKIYKGPTGKEFSLRDLCGDANGVRKVIDNFRKHKPAQRTTPQK